jgi:hypothetical protein
LGLSKFGGPGGGVAADILKIKGAPIIMAVGSCKSKIVILTNLIQLVLGALQICYTNTQLVYWNPYSNNMVKKVVSLVVMIASLYTILILRLKPYVYDYNIQRVKNNISVVHKDWDIDYDLLNGKVICLNKKSLRRKHLRKSIEVNYWGGIKVEVDYYLIEDKEISIDVVYDYKSDSPWNIRYYNEFGSMNKLTRLQLSDTLSKYKVID